MSSPYREFRFSEVSLAPNEPGNYAWYQLDDFESASCSTSS